jgi:hypothetical protein
VRGRMTLNRFYNVGKNIKDRKLPLKKRTIATGSTVKNAEIFVKILNISVVIYPMKQVKGGIK